jgi:hypothetical protein
MIVNSLKFKIAKKKEVIIDDLDIECPNIECPEIESASDIVYDATIPELQKKEYNFKEFDEVDKEEIVSVVINVPEKKENPLDLIKKSIEEKIKSFEKKTDK